MMQGLAHFYDKYIVGTKTQSYETIKNMSCSHLHTHVQHGHHLKCIVFHGVCVFLKSGYVI